MPDLSRLLEDVYGTSEEEPAPAPDQESHAVLHEMLAGWSPGEPAATPAVAPEAEPEATIAPAAVTDLAMDPVPPVVTIAPWNPSDDDLLPTRRRGLKLSFRR